MSLIKLSFMDKFFVITLLLNLLLNLNGHLCVVTDPKIEPMTIYFEKALFFYPKRQEIVFYLHKF